MLLPKITAQTHLLSEMCSVGGLSTQSRNVYERFDIKTANEHLSATENIKIACTAFRADAKKSKRALPTIRRASRVNFELFHLWLQSSLFLVVPKPWEYQNCDWVNLFGRKSSLTTVEFVHSFRIFAHVFFRLNYSIFEALPFNDRLAPWL